MSQRVITAVSDRPSPDPANTTNRPAYPPTHCIVFDAAPSEREQDRIERCAPVRDSVGGGGGSLDYRAVDKILPVLGVVVVDTRDNKITRVSCRRRVCVDEALQTNTDKFNVPSCQQEPHHPNAQSSPAGRVSKSSLHVLPSLLDRAPIKTRQQGNVHETKNFWKFIQVFSTHKSLAEFCFLFQQRHKIINNGKC